MYPSMKAELAARDGDLRLCLLLGLAAWFLFLDHVPHNAVSLLTMRNFGFSGATEADLQASHFDHLRDLRKHESV